MKKLILLLGFISQISIAQIPNLNWAISNDGAGGNDFGLATVTDNMGNVYSTGAFKFQVDFDPGPANTMSLSAGLNDMYVQKLDPSGNLVWVIRVGGTNEEVGRGIALDPSGNVIITGNYIGTATDFDPGPGVSTLVGSGLSDVFVLKLSSSGSFMWAKLVGGVDEDMGYSVCTDANSNIIVGGFFRQTVDFNPGAGVNNLTSVAGCQNGFILKLDQNGSFLWADHLSSTGNGWINAIKANKNNEIAVVGYFDGDMDFDPGIAVVLGFTSFGYDGFMVKLNSNGSFAWGHQLGTINTEIYYDLQFDGNLNIVATGYINGGGVDFDPGAGTFYLASMGGYTTFVQKIDSAGSFAWANVFGSTGNDNGYSIDVDDAGNVVTTGCFAGVADLDPGAGVSNYTSYGAADAFIQKMDMNGNFLWAKQIGGTADDIPRGLSIDPYGNIAISGYFNATADFDPSASVFNLTSGGGSDIFSVNFKCIATIGNINVSSCGNYSSPSGRYVWTTNGTYYDTIANKEGCDSLMTIHLTIISGSQSTINPNTCYSYTSPSGNYTWSVSGNYMDTIPNAAGCDSVMNINLTIKTVDTTITLVNGTFTATQSGATYQWGDCNAQAIIPGATGQSYTPVADGSYAVIITYNGCSDTSNCHGILNVGIEERFQKPFHISPNPSNSFVNISGASRIEKIEMLDIIGNIVLDRSAIHANDYKLDLANYASGVYVLKIYGINQVTQYKLLKN